MYIYINMLSLFIESRILPKNIAKIKNIKIREGIG
jgi:hypothetical protein